MQNNIILVNGNELQVKEYNGQRVVTLWDIARLHGITPNHLKTTFEKHKDKLVEGEDYFILKKEDALAYNLIVSNEIDYHTVNAVKTVVAFAESGYLMITKPIGGEIAWIVHRELVKNYFAMREVREVIKQQLDPNSALETSKFLIQLADAAGVSPQAKLLATKNVYKLAGIELPFDIKLEEKLYDADAIAKNLGILSEAGIPHGRAVSAILKKLNVPEDMAVITFEAKGNWQGSVIKYKEATIDIITKWLKDNKYPRVIEGNKQKYKVQYSA